MKLFITWLIILLINKIVIKINNYVLIRKNSNKNLVLDVAVNQDELVNANEIVEITPKVKPIPEYNVYNDYLDIVPIKKEKTIILPLEETVFKNNYEEEFQVENNIETTNQLLKSEYVSNNYLNLENDKELENNLLNTPTINQVLPKNDEILNQIKSQTLSLDELLNEVWENSEKKLTTIKIEPEYEFPKSKASSISLGSYDEIFKEIKIDNQEELDNLFKEESNYLSNIMLDINELKTKQDDPNQIRKIYNNIKLNENNLTLNDYNYLINRLLDIKK